MNVHDRTITALTPGSPFNANGLIWRSVQSLAQFAGISPEETLEMLAGDLAELVTVRPSKTGKGLLAALKEHIPQAADPGTDEQVSVAGGPAFNAPTPGSVPEEPVQAESPPLADAPGVEGPVGQCAGGFTGAAGVVEINDVNPEKNDEEFPPGMNPAEPAMD